MRILVFGGSKYFGRRLVMCLAEAGHHVTVATRGNLPVASSAQVNAVRCDRGDATRLREVANEGPWDLIYDQICYSPDDANQLIEAFNGRAKRLVMTSSQSVYNRGAALQESIFDPNTTPIEHGARDQLSYQRGKQLAESVYSQRAKFPVAMVRFPIVLGLDDYTRRLHWHIERCIKGLPVYFPNRQGKISFISSFDAAAFLEWSGNQNYTGPMNAASPEPVRLVDLIESIEKECGKKMKLIEQSEADAESPFGIESDWFMDTSKATKLGFKFSPASEWIETLITNIVENGE